MTFPVACEEEFDRLSKEDPDKLLAWVELGEMRPSELTFAAERLGRNPAALPKLLELAKHESAMVREGALYGLHTLMSDIDCTIGYMADADESPGVRASAKELYNEWHTSF